MQAERPMILHEITSAKGDAAREIDRWLDPAATIKSIDADEIVRTNAKGEIMDY